MIRACLLLILVGICVAAYIFAPEFINRRCEGEILGLKTNQEGVVTFTIDKENDEKCDLEQFIADVRNCVVGSRYPECAE